MQTPDKLSQEDSSTDLDTPSSTTSSIYKFANDNEDANIHLKKKQRIWECVYSSEEASPQVTKTAKEGHAFQYSERRGGKVYK